MAWTRTRYQLKLKTGSSSLHKTWEHARKAALRSQVIGDFHVTDTETGETRSGWVYQKNHRQLGAKLSGRSVLEDGSHASGPAAEAARRWWRIGRPNGQPVYGYGTEDEARRCCDRLDAEADLEVGLHVWMEASPDVAEALDAGRRDDGFALEHALDGTYDV